MKSNSRITNFIALLVFMTLNSFFAIGQQATVKEEMLSMNTYMFSDPSSIPQIGRLYPYFRFDGYTDQAEPRLWKMVVLENDYIKVYVCPDIGGKVWGAIEKSTGKEFLYFNHSVKFRDVAMRGAWTSGGLEYNFGDIGHIPTCATPVDYKIKTNDDGSVSCFVGALDLPSRTNWNVEIRLPKDKAYFQTKAIWVNNTRLPVTYYHWMNAAAKADGNLEFLVPGSKRIGHGGELGDWPEDHGKKIKFYEDNDFGIYKSYHVINAYSDYFGGYYHDDDFGFGHHSTYDDKPGKKIWIWGLSDQGMIWEDLLTDSDGQYIEYQAGKLFNQAANSSSMTPFKHREFSPFDTDEMIEYWFPLKETGGMVAASKAAVLNVIRNGTQVRLQLSPLQELKETVYIQSNGELIEEFEINANVLERLTHEFELDSNLNFEVIVGDRMLYYSSDVTQEIVERPTMANDNFNWNSSYGKYVAALEQEKQRNYGKALDNYLASYELEPGFSPTLNRLSMAYYRLGNYKEALKYAELSLAIDTYDPLGNYSFGLIHAALNNSALAKSGFSISSQNTTYRSASYTELAVLYLKEKDLKKAIFYADRALMFNRKNMQALEIKAMASRLGNDSDTEIELLIEIEHLDGINHFVISERMFLGQATAENLKSRITNELPTESYLELAMKYMNYGRSADAIEVLKLAPENPMVLLWLAYLNADQQDEYLKKALNLSAEMVFPHRLESADMLKYFIEKDNNWKLKYYLSLIYWNKGLTEQAKDLVLTCGKDPDLAIFYLTKAKLFQNDGNKVDEALNRAMELDPASWRTNLALIERYLDTGEYEPARKIAHKFVRKHPEKAIFGMSYAKALMGLGRYDQCIQFLSGYQVLPFEGATEGRLIYHQACIKAAYEAMKKGKFTKATAYAEKAKLWPRNLGVGKPYDVDERLDDFIAAMSLRKIGKIKEAEEAFQKVAAHRSPDYLNENSKLMLQLEALRLLDRNVEALDLLEKAKQKESKNAYIMWVEAKVKNRDPKSVERSILGQDHEIMAYDTTFVDNEFELLLEGLDIFEQDLN